MIAIEPRLPIHPFPRLKSMIEQTLEGSWLVVEIDGEPVDPAAPRSVRFEDDRISGKVGVNRFTGSFTLNGAMLEVGPVALTRMAGPPDLMALEQRFTSHLEGALEVGREGTELTLSEGGQAILLSRAPTLSVRGTVTYRERIMLPPDSTVIVELVDISIADVAVEPIASQVIVPATAPPFSFSLECVEDIDERRMLAVRGRIVSPEGDVLWATEYPAVITDRAEPVELILLREG
jgi:heat shock protein HslJ